MLSNIKVLTSYFFLAARRDKLIYSMFALLSAAFAICTFLGGTAVHEAEQMQVVYISGAFRTICVYGFIIFLSFFVVKIAKTREIETILAGPISRDVMIASLLLTAIILVSLTICICAIGVLISYKYIIIKGFLMWLASLYFELIITSLFCIFFAVMLENTVLTIFLTTSMYIISRITGFFISLITLNFDTSSFWTAIDWIVVTISVFIPRFDLFTQSQWLIYADSFDLKSLYIILAQFCIYTPLLLLACMSDFRKKQF